jgi:rare lipoprotein A
MSGPASAGLLFARFSLAVLRYSSCADTGSLPFGSKVAVINKRNGQAATVTITDRGPYVKGRCTDLSQSGAHALGFAGLAPVSVVPVISD